MPGIVVGIDGSSNSERALGWAMKEAALRHASLTVIAVHPVTKSYWTGKPVTFEAESGEVEKIRQIAQELTHKAASELSDVQPASVTVHAVNGFPAQELIEASRDADLVVVGSRGTGGFSRLLLGSVSSQVVHHAECPVVVVPYEQ